MNIVAEQFLREMTVNTPWDNETLTMPPAWVWEVLVTFIENVRAMEGGELVKWSLLAQEAFRAGVLAERNGLDTTWKVVGG
jgi:hypothetical protein